MYYERILAKRYHRQLLPVLQFRVPGPLCAGKSVPEPLRDEYNSLAAKLRGAAADRQEGT